MKDAFVGLFLLGVLIAFVVILPLVQPTLTAWNEIQLMYARATAQHADALATSAALDNSAKAQAMGERQTAAASELNATSTAVHMAGVGTAAAITQEAKATAVAVQATQDANMQQATATAHAQEVLFHATATAEVHNEGNATVNAYAQRGSTVIGVVFLAVLIFAAFGLSIAANGWVSRRGKQVARDPGTGLALPIYQDGRIIVPEHLVGDVQYQKPGADWRIYRLVNWFRTGKWLPEPEPKPYGLGTGVTAEQLTQLASETNRALIARSIYSNVGTEHQLKERQEGVRKLSTGNALMVVPPTQVLDNDQLANALSQAVMQRLREEGSIPGESDGVP